MSFSKLLNNLTGLLSTVHNEERESTQNTNDDLVNELHQGMKLLNSRKIKISKLKGRMKLIENLSGFEEGDETLQKTSQAELNILENLESNYNRQLSNYSINYKSFMDTYYRAVDQVQKCKADCRVSIPESGGKSSNKRLACQTGCELKGPYVQKCANTFRTSRIGGKPCSQATIGRCEKNGDDSGSVVLGMDSVVNSIDYADSNNTTIGDGCCDCGGGAGGPPYVTMRAKKITKCEQIPGAFGFSADSGSYMTTACHNARVGGADSGSTNADANGNLHQKYEELATQNEELIKSAQLIFNKITELTEADSKIKVDIDSKGDDFIKHLSEYSETYAKIISRQGKKGSTMDGQVEDIMYKEDSSQLQLWIWTGLAILTILFVIQKARK